MKKESNGIFIGTGVIFLILLIIPYVCLSIFSGTWDPMLWIKEAKEASMLLVLLAVAGSFVIFTILKD